MPLLTKAQFFDQLRIASFNFELPEVLQSSQTKGGQIYTTSTGIRLWRGSITCQLSTHQNQQSLHALMRTIQRPGMFFDIAPIHALQPANRIAQSFANAKVNNAQSAGYTLSVKGLPGSFNLARGDFLSFPINGANRLYEIAEDVSTGSGTASIKLTHPLTAGALPANNTVVSFTPALLTCQYVPGTMQFGAFGLGYAEGFSFQFQQATRII